MGPRIIIATGIAVMLAVGQGNSGNTRPVSAFDAGTTDTSAWISYTPRVGFVQEVLDPVTYRVVLYAEVTYAAEFVCPGPPDGAQVFTSYLELEGVRTVRLVGLEKLSKEEDGQAAVTQLEKKLKGERLDVRLDASTYETTDSATTWALVNLGDWDRGELLNVFVLEKGWACPNGADRKSIPDAVWSRMTAATREFCNPG